MRSRSSARLMRGLGLDVERAGRLVEDQDRRVLEDGAGDGEALALAARQRGAALADDEVVAAGLLGEDEVVRLGELARPPRPRRRVASGRPMRMFSAIERLKRPASWNTTAIDWRSEVSVTSAMSWPSMRMRPCRARAGAAAGRAWWSCRRRSGRRARRSRRLALRG